MPWLSQYLADRRTRQILPYLSGSILDIGCGYNPLCKYMQDRSNYAGVEREAHIVTWLKVQFPDVPFYQCDLNREPLEIPGQYDTIVMMAVIEHLKDPEQVLSQLPRYLKPGGKLVLTTPTPIGNWLHHVGARVRMTSQLAADEHHVILTRRSIARLFEQTGFRLAHHRSFLWGGNQIAVGEPAI